MGTCQSKSSQKTKRKQNTHPSNIQNPSSQPFIYYPVPGNYSPHPPPSSYHPNSQMQSSQFQNLHQQPIPVNHPQNQLSNSQIYPPHFQSQHPPVYYYPNPHAGHQSYPYQPSAAQNTPCYNPNHPPLQPNEISDALLQMLGQNNISQEISTKQKEAEEQKKEEVKKPVLIESIEIEGEKKNSLQNDTKMRIKKTESIDIELSKFESPKKSKKA